MFKALHVFIPFAYMISLVAQTQLIMLVLTTHNRNKHKRHENNPEIMIYLAEKKQKNREAAKELFCLRIKQLPLEPCRNKLITNDQSAYRKLEISVRLVPTVGCHILKICNAV